MKNSLTYKAFYGSVEFSDEENIFFGRIIEINDRITYEGDTVKSLRKGFNAAVDEYLDVCAKLGKEPEKPYKGSFIVRIEPVLHRQLVMYSTSQGKSLNSVVAEAITNYVS